MDELKLSTQLINAILQYLHARPFGEVVGLISEIQKQAASQGAQSSPAEPERSGGTD